MGVVGRFQDVAANKRLTVLEALLCITHEVDCYKLEVYASLFQASKSVRIPKIETECQVSEASIVNVAFKRRHAHDSQTQQLMLKANPDWRKCCVPPMGTEYSNPQSVCSASRFCNFSMFGSI